MRYYLLYIISMKDIWRFINRVWSGEEGSPAIEFAFAAPAMVMMVIGAVEFGMIVFLSTLIESGLRDASRYGITGSEVSGASRMERIVQIVSERTLGLVDMAEADVDVLVYPGFSDIGRGEDYVDGNANGAYDMGETFTDANANGVWDADVGIAGAGAAGDVVVYKLRYDWPLLTPFAGTFIGTGGTFPIAAAIAVRNEPWDTAGGQP